MSSLSTMKERFYSRLTPQQKATLSRVTSRKRTSGIQYARPRNRSQLEARGGVSRPMTLAEKQAYAIRKGIRYTPRPVRSEAGIPSWTKSYATVNGNRVYRQYNTQTFYYQKGNTVYRHDRRNNRYYLLDNGVMSGGIVIPYNNVPNWVIDTARQVSS